MNSSLVRNVILGSAVLVIAAGCASTSTRVESRPLTETEKVWAQNLQKWYPGWRPPHLAPAQTAETEAAVLPLPPAVPAATAAAAGAEPAAVEQPATAPDTGVDLVPAAPGESKSPRAAAAKGTHGKPVAVKKYTVKAGDTLEKIAKKCYGKTSAWKHILDSNRRVISSPNKLRAGMVLKITPLP